MLITINAFYSELLNNEREIAIFLPPRYNRHRRKRYPVIYLQDGQRLFDRGSTPGSMQWGIDLVALPLMKNHLVQELIMVGISHSADREYEYTPTYDEEEQGGGGADRYCQFLISELKPFIDDHFRTLSSRSNTAIGGSSLGGLLALYAGITYGHIFGKIACISPSLWWNNYTILEYVQTRQPLQPRPRIWLDTGTDEEESDDLLDWPAEDDELDPLEQAQLLAEIFVRQGYRRGRNLRFFTGYGASHDEFSWGARFDRILRFLFAHKRSP
ncbi:alpha/beta hydrolase [candidate division CSSED10-310 bacterium]|uniref:Alpha/beta hydrolase n=1 Tax=candidate division CSSED10-310 bacterium TaxID=2855610 RepID=A0ABV6Z3F3_UNCC1